jgi:hypothetical protein
MSILGRYFKFKCIISIMTIFKRQEIIREGFLKLVYHFLCRNLVTALSPVMSHHYHHHHHHHHMIMTYIFDHILFYRGHIMLRLVIKYNFNGSFPLAYSKQIFHLNHNTQCYPKSLLILLYENRPPPDVKITKSTST